jgi:hypothetical protein
MEGLRLEETIYNLKQKNNHIKILWFLILGKSDLSII